MVIYKVKCLINNKIYFGESVSTFDNRYPNGIENDTHNIDLKNDILKYGILNFDIDKEFSYAENEDQLNKLEDMYIKLYNTTNSKYGYNKKFGGKCGKQTEETKKKISDKQKERCRDGLTKECKKVICITTNEVFDSAKEGAKKYNIKHPSQINLCCRMKCNYAGKLKDGTKLIWRFI